MPAQKKHQDIWFDTVGRMDTVLIDSLFFLVRKKK